MSVSGTTLWSLMWCRCNSYVRLPSTVVEVVVVEACSSRSGCSSGALWVGVSTGADNRSSVGVGEDTVDVDVVPTRQFRSTAIDCRPSVFHRACGADFVYRVDSATNTRTQVVVVVVVVVVVCHCTCSSSFYSLYSFVVLSVLQYLLLSV